MARISPIADSKVQTHSNVGRDPLRREMLEILFSFSEDLSPENFEARNYRYSEKTEELFEAWPTSNYTASIARPFPYYDVSF